MAIGTDVPRGRQLAAAGSLVGAGLGWLELAHHGPVVGYGLAVVAFLAAVGFARRSVLSQVLARGAGWLTFVFGLSATISLFDPLVAAITVAAGAALLLSVPMLHTPAARAEFAPVRFRRAFLAAATSTVAFATLTGGAGVAMLAFERSPLALGWLAIAASFLGAAVGVVRMRAWGVLLGVFTSTVMMIAAVLSPHWREVLLMLATPGALLALPVVLARLGLTREDLAVAPAVRVGDVASPPVRIAVEADAVEDDDLEATDEARTVRRLAP